MSRSARQSKILSIIASNEIETQEDLVSQLRYEGYDVTQATISRDIKELGLIKTLTPSNTYKYSTKQSLDVKLSGKLMSLVREAVLNVVTAENIVVVKTLNESAQAVHSALEQLSFAEVVGSIADRNTIIIVSGNANTAQVLAKKIEMLL